MMLTSVQLYCIVQHHCNSRRLQNNRQSFLNVENLSKNIKFARKRKHFNGCKVLVNKYPIIKKLNFNPTVFKDKPILSNFSDNETG